MSSGRSLYQRRPERYAREKKHFQRLIYKLKRLALKRGYTKIRASSSSLEKLLATTWDLVVFDGAHKLGAHFFDSKLEKTGRFILAEKLGARTWANTRVAF